MRLITADREIEAATLEEYKEAAAEAQPRRKYGAIYPGSDNIKGLAARIEAGHRRNTYTTDLYAADLQAIREGSPDLYDQLMNAFYLGLEAGHHAAAGGQSGQRGHAAKENKQPAGDPVRQEPQRTRSAGNHTLKTE